MKARRGPGRQIPKDGQVLGFDNRFEARTHDPPLTTINQPAYEIGWQSLELMLLRLAQPGQVNADAVTRVSTQLVIRESCGCKPGSISTNPSYLGIPQSDLRESL